MSRQLFEEAKKVLQAEAAVKLDPVGQEDKDIDNNGKVDSTDKYLKKRRGAISAAIASSKNEGVQLSDEDAQRVSDILKGVQEEVEQIDEVGDTPAGRAALTAVQARAHSTMDAWSKNPKSGYSSTPKAVRKATHAAVMAGNRLHGFGPDKLNANTVMARSALRQKLASQGIGEEVEHLDETPKDDDAPRHGTFPYGRRASPPSDAIASRYGRTSASPTSARFTKASHGFGIAGPKAKLPEETEQVEEMKGQPAAPLKGPKPGEVPAYMRKGNARQRFPIDLKDLKKNEEIDNDPVSEIVEARDAFTIELPETLTYQDYLKAAMQAEGIESLKELEDENLMPFLAVVEQLFTEGEEEFVISELTYSEMQDKIYMHQKQGNKVTGVERKTMNGQPYAAYVVTDKNGMRRKYIYQGNVRRVQNLGQANKPNETNPLED